MKADDLLGLGHGNVQLTLLAEEEGCLDVECAGDLRLAIVPPENDAFVTLLGPEAYSRRVLLNLGKVQYLDTSGVSWLIMNHKRFAKNGGALVLHSITPLVNEIIKLLSLERVLHIGANSLSARALALQPKP